MKKKILIVDDDADFRSAIRVIMENEGCGCAEADSAENGMRAVYKVKPDLIILDVMMEDISSGFRFLKELRSGEKKDTENHIPILMVTSVQALTNLDFLERMKSFFLPKDSFLDKPVDSDVILKKIKEMIPSISRRL